MQKQSTGSQAGIHIQVKNENQKIDKDLELNHSFCLFNFMEHKMGGGGGGGALGLLEKMFIKCLPFLTLNNVSLFTLLVKLSNYSDYLMKTYRY